MLIGVNADGPRHGFDPDQIAECGVAFVRFPLWFGGNHLPFYADCRQRNAEPVLILDRASFSAHEWRYGSYRQRIGLWARSFPGAKYVQAGNEPDQSGASSSRQTKSRYYRLIRETLRAWPEATIIAGGLVHVDFSYLDGLPRCHVGRVIAAVHPYAQTADTVPALVVEMRNHWDGPLWATEVGVPSRFYDTLHERARWHSDMLIALWKLGIGAAFIFPWHRVMEPDFDGLIDDDGNPNEIYAAVASAVPALAGRPPETTLTRFSVWTGAHINPSYRLASEIVLACLALNPGGYAETEWLVKAGEGGTWQSRFDSHPLAVRGPHSLAALIQVGRENDVRVTPYVVVRGRPEWTPAEHDQVVACAEVAGRVVLNLEPGRKYWNGPTDAAELRDSYIDPLAARLPAGVEVELCVIPRLSNLQNIGGLAALDAWLSICSSCSWECYDATAPDLNVALAMSRVGYWLDVIGKNEPRYKIPVVQRSRVDAWAGSGHDAPGLQVWHLDGD